MIKKINEKQISFCSIPDEGDWKFDDRTFTDVNPEPLTYAILLEIFTMIESHRYQVEKRFYLDEYLEQEKLREDFFKAVLEERKKNPFYQFQNRFNKVV